MSDNTYPQYSLVFQGRREIARDTYEFSFEKPTHFIYSAGQNIRLYFRDLPEEKKHRTLTIASAPYEQTLLVAVRVRESLFKARLMNLKRGDIVEAEGPTGHKFSLHKDTNVPAVFLAGGIGVVPAYSIIKDAIKNTLQHSFTLFYSNRHEEDIPYRKELETLAEENSHITLVRTLTKANPSHWQGERGYINASMIQKYVADISHAMFYVSGPPEMLDGVQGVLLDMHVPDNHILTKRFSGY